jgi:hypothetical protein
MLALAAGAIGCRQQMQPLPELEGGVELALRRGSSWSTLKVRPPLVVGPRVTLEIKQKMVSGSIDGRAVRLQIEEDGVKGTGPSGSVAVDISGSPDQMLIEGTWNGGRVHFDITADSFKGSLPIFQARTLSSVYYCQYVLDRTDKDGARIGTSICEGMPEETRLEVPRQVQGWLTRQELAVVLLALLSSPPFTRFEGG